MNVSISPTSFKISHDASEGLRRAVALTLLLSSCVSRNLAKKKATAADLSEGAADVYTHEAEAGGGAAGGVGTGRRGVTKTETTREINTNKK